MANQNISEYTIQWIFFGLLFFALLSFAVIFVANNNEDAFGTSANKFDTSSLEAELLTTDDKVDPLLNITAGTNPEAGDLGSRDSVAVSYGLKGSSKGFIESTQMFMGWIFTGTAGKIIISVFVGIFSIASLYFIIKSIRTGT